MDAAPPFDFARCDYPLAPLTLYNVGGPARVALFPPSLDDARAAYRWMAAQPGRKLVLGGGSNVLISDAGFDGIVLATTRLDRIEPLGGDRWRAEAGVLLDRLVREVMLEHNYAGVGGLAGIPGSVGGAAWMNAGTVNGTVCELMASAEVVGPDSDATVALRPELYGYRGQTFCPPGGLILAATFAFHRAQDDQRAIYDRYIQRRREKQPRGYCCGSVFKNPPNDHAGRLIEACGLKGERRGGALISPMHANFIMNEDGATFGEIRELMALAQMRVKERFGILLEPEVFIVERQ